MPLSFRDLQRHLIFIDTEVYIYDLEYKFTMHQKEECFPLEFEVRM
jgi:hypothetical protein